MALDEPTDKDEQIKVGNQPFIIDKEFLEKAKPLTVDFNGMGFQIDSGMELPKNGCDGCAC